MPELSKTNSSKDKARKDNKSKLKGSTKEN